MIDPLLQNCQRNRFGHYFSLALFLTKTVSYGTRCVDWEYVREITCGREYHRTGAEKDSWEAVQCS